MRRITVAALAMWSKWRMGAAVVYFYIEETECIDKCLAKGENLNSCMAICD